MINNVVLIGRLTRDVELRYTPSNVAVATFNLAVNRNFKNQQTFLGCQIDTITFDSPNVQPVEDRYAEEIAELKKEVNACYREKAEDQSTIEFLKDKCVNLMLENADYVWDEMARSAMAKRANKRKWMARGCI